MLTEILGLCIVLLIKYRGKLLGALQTIYGYLFSPPPRWLVNKRELQDKRFQVGETVKFVIKYVGEGSFHEDLACLRLQIFQNSQPIVHLKEVLEEEKSIRVKFSVQKACLTRIELYDRNQNVSQSSPINVAFLPGVPEPDKTICLKPSPIIQCTTFIDKCVHIQPRDRFENNCLVCDVDLECFQFEAMISDHSMEKSALCDSSFQFASNYSSEVLLKIQFQHPGIFSGSVALNGQVIGGHSSFNIVSLTNGEEADLQYILANSPSWKYHEGRLRALDNKIDSRNKKIYIYVSQKQISVQEYILKFIPIRIATFRVSPMTRMELLFADNDQNNYTFSIHDCIQPKVTLEMDQRSTRLVYAMFTHFLQKRHGGSESFADKQKYFYTELTDVRNKGGTLRISFVTLKINRSDLVNSSLQRTYYYNSKDWCKNFRIEFEDEEGLDGGGLRREWLDLICTKLFENSETGLFSSFGSSRLVHPNPSRDTAWTNRHYEFAGKIVGKCLFESAVGDSYKTMVNGRFTRSFLAQIIGLRPNYKHFEQDDPELYMSKVKYILENDVDKLELTFADEEYKGQLMKIVDLIPNGSTKLVTNENKEEYLNALANYRLGTKVKKEIEAFCKGLHYIVPDELLSQFDENELELLMCGKSEFSVKDLRKNFSASFTLGFDADYHRVVEWFFMSVENMTEDEKAKLLQFITGSSLLPHGGFANLSPRLRIILGAEYGKLPTAQTCANQICLSDHNSFEDFEKCLLLAVNEGNQGFGFK